MLGRQAAERGERRRHPTRGVPSAQGSPTRCRTAAAVRGDQSRPRQYATGLSRSRQKTAGFPILGIWRPVSIEDSGWFRRRSRRSACA